MPDYGPSLVPPRTGLTLIGATRWVVNYNVLLRCDDLALVRRVARGVSQRGGGLPMVEAMALRHTQGERGSQLVNLKPGRPRLWRPVQCRVRGGAQTVNLKSLPTSVDCRGSEEAV